VKRKEIFLGARFGVTLLSEKRVIGVRGRAPIGSPGVWGGAPIEKWFLSHVKEDKCHCGRG
jgi:hypothetical protein